MEVLGSASILAVDMVREGHLHHPLLWSSLVDRYQRHRSRIKLVVSMSNRGLKEVRVRYETSSTTLGDFSPSERRSRPPHASNAPDSRRLLVIFSPPACFDFYDL